MQPSGSGISPKAVGWALLSQMVWLPLVAIDQHDRWVAHQRDITPPGRPLPDSPIARARPFSLNDLLGAARPVQQLASQAGQSVGGAVGQAVSGAGVLLSSAGSGVSSLLDRPYSASVDAPARAGSSGSEGYHGASNAAGELPFSGAGTGLLARTFTRAQLLGGGMGLADLNEGPMSALALVERSLMASSGDPLAPLPSLWREPMRQALQKLPGSAQQRLGIARLVVLPSSRVSQPTDVPLALQSDGSVDVLQPPSDPAVLGEIESWSRRQRPPVIGSVVPAVVHLHPLPADLQAAPAAPVSRATVSRPGSSAASRSPRPVGALPAAAASRPVVAPAPTSAPADAAPPQASEPAAPPLPAAASAPVPASVPAAQDRPAAAAPDQAAFVLTPPPPLPGGPVAVSTASPAGALTP